MSYKFRVVQNKMEESKNYGKWYAMPVVISNVTTDQLCDEISHSTTVTESDVRAVFAELKVKLRDHLLNNQSVKVDGLGTFNVRLKSTATEVKKEFNVSRIKNVTVGFLPEQTTLPNQIIDSNGKSLKVRYKRLLEGMTFEEFQYDKPAEKKSDTGDNSGQSTEQGTESQG